MLKEITRAEAVERMAEEKPVFALFEIDGTMTINDLLTTDGFVIEVPNEETLKAIKESIEHPEQGEKYHSVDELIEHLEPRKASSEPRNEAIDVSSEVKRQLSEVKRKLSEEKKAEKTGGRKSKYDRGKVAALTKAGWSVKQIADELGCTDNTVRYIQKKNKEAEIKAESEGTEVNYDN